MRLVGTALSTALWFPSSILNIPVVAIAGIKRIRRGTDTFSGQQWSTFNSGPVSLWVKTNGHHASNLALFTGHDSEF